MLKRLPELTRSPSTNPASQHTRNGHALASPLYASRGDFTAMMHCCSTQTLEIITDMYTLTQAVRRQRSRSRAFIPSHPHLEMYNRLQSLPSTQGSDWMHESVRLTALIYTNAILHHTTFSSAANIQHEDAIAGDRTLLCALLSAVAHTNVTGCWDDMRGVFLWVCLIGGVAAWDAANTETGLMDPPIAWARKCFSLWMIRAVVGVGFEHVDGMMEVLKAGLQVRNFLDGR